MNEVHHLSQTEEKWYGPRRMLYDGVLHYLKYYGPDRSFPHIREKGLIKMYTVNLKFNDVSNIVDEHKVHGTEVANNSFVKKWLALKRAFWFLRVVFTGTAGEYTPADQPGVVGDPCFAAAT